MIFKNLLGKRTSRRPRAQTAAYRKRSRLRTELLEDRRLLAVVVWDGGGSDQNWRTAENWATDVAPVANDELVFPVSPSSFSALNDFPANTSFASILISGSGYSLGGNAIELSGSVSSTGSGNTFSMPITLGSNGGFSSASGTFTVDSDINNAGNLLSLDAASGALTISGSISGSGGVSTSGSQFVTLSGDNSYSGVTTIGGNTLVVQHDNALGAGDNTAATGTILTSNSGELRLDGGVTIQNELYSSTDVYLYLESYGETSNTWSSDLISNQDIFLKPNYNNRLVLDGSLFTGSGSLLRIEGSDTGTVVINGTVSTNYVYIYRGTAEINSAITTVNRPNAHEYYGGRLSGTGSVSWTNSSSANLGGSVRPGTHALTGTLTLDGDAIFNDFYNRSGLEIRLGGATAGTGYDQLIVNGDVQLAGELDVTLLSSFASVGDSFTILENTSTGTTAGTFDGLSEDALISVDGEVFSISYSAGTDSNDVVLTKVLAGIWDGEGSDGNWMNAVNWVGDVAPLPGANLLFPESVAQTSTVNDFPAETSFGSILISGGAYSFTGNAIELNGSVSSAGSGNTFSIPVTLGGSGGFSSGSGTFTVDGDIDNAGNPLSLNAANGYLTISGSISGSGDVTTNGNLIVTLAGDNSYSGVTSIGSNTLVAAHDNALGAGDSTAATGTILNSNSGELRLDGGVTIQDELYSSTDNYLYLESVGTTTNTWSGDLVSNQEISLKPSYNNRLVLDGSLSTGTSWLLRVNGNNTGTAVINGSVSTYYIYVNGGSAEINSPVTTTNAPRIYQYSDSRLSGAGSHSWTNTSFADLGGKVRPGTSEETGLLTLNGDATFNDSQNRAGLEIRLGGTTPGSGYDQLIVNGNVQLAGDLDVTLLSSFASVGDSFTILENTSTGTTTGTFDGLGEGDLISVDGEVFSISYSAGTDSNDVVLTKVLAGIWDGEATDGNWMNAVNWVGDVAPLPGANLLFPESVAQTSTVNDFPAETSFGSILISGAGYSFTGNAIELNGSVSSADSGNTFSIPVTLGGSGGFSSGFGTFTVDSDIDNAGNLISLNATSGSLTLSGSISGSGGVTTGGNLIVTLSGDNSYSGVTSIGSNTLVAAHDNALGAGDSTAATGTILTSNSGELRLDGGVTIQDELYSSTDNYLYLESFGTTNNTWSGDLISNQEIFLKPNYNNRLILDGSLSTGTSSLLRIDGNDAGTAVINGAVSTYYIYVNRGTAEINSAVNTTISPRIYHYYGARLSGTGSHAWTNASPADLGGKVRPGTSDETGLLTLDGDATFNDSQNRAGLEVRLGGTTAGSGYDQLIVNGDVQLAGNLDVTLLSSFASVGDSFTILENTSTGTTTGTFDGLPENGLVEYGGNIFRISYVGGTDANDVVLSAITTNHFPTGDAQTLETQYDTPINITLTGNDIDGDSFGFSVESSPSNGSLSGTVPNLTYTPTPGYFGTDSFDFRVTDDEGGFSIATISIDVLPPMAVVGTVPTIGQGAIGEGITDLEVLFNQDPVFASGDITIAISSDGADRLLGTADDVAIATTAAGTGSDSVAVSFDPLVAGSYRLTVSNSGDQIYLNDFVVTDDTTTLFSTYGSQYEVQTGGTGAGQVTHAGLYSGSGSAFDGLYRLQVDGSSINFDPTLATTDDGGETSITSVQAVPISGLGGDELRVSREVTVSYSGYDEFARTIDVFENATASDITTTIELIGNLGSDANTIVFNTSDGDTDVEVTDQWIGTDDADDDGSAALIHMVHGADGLQPTDVQVVGDNIFWTYDITVPAGETVRLATFTIQDALRSTAEFIASDFVTETGFRYDAELYLTENEKASIANFTFPAADDLTTAFPVAMQLRDATDQVLTGTHTLEYTLYDAATAGNQLAYSITTDVDVSFIPGGFYQFDLADYLGVLNLPAEGLFLEISVDGVPAAQRVELNGDVITTTAGDVTIRNAFLSSATRNVDNATWALRLLGNLRELSDVPAAGVVAWQASLFDSETGGIAVYSDSGELILNDSIGGSFGINLGQNTPLDLQILSDNTDLWVELTVQGEMLPTRFKVDGGGLSADTTNFRFDTLYAARSFDLMESQDYGPDTVSVAGLLIDSVTGVPITGEHSFEFAIYDAYAGITVYSETATIDVTDGIYGSFAHGLGSVTPLDMNLLKAPELYLEISVDGRDPVYQFNPLDTASNFVFVPVDLNPATVVSTFPSLDSGSTESGVSYFDIEFSAALDSNTGADSAELRGLGADGLLGTADDDVIDITSYASGSYLYVYNNYDSLTEGVFRLTISDVLTDAYGDPIDGDADGVVGGDYVVDFVVLPTGLQVLLPPVEVASSLSDVSQIVAADLNYDGYLDFVTTRYDDSLIVLGFGDGEGGFTTQSISSLGTLPNTVAVADFNSDGYDDLVVGERGSSWFAVYLNDGFGVFTSVAPISGGTFSREVVAVDLNNDGNKDLVMQYDSGVDGDVHVVLGDGLGGFSGGYYASPAGTNGQGFRPLDWNGDGYMDIAYTPFSNGSVVRFLMNDGSGNLFESTNTLPVGNYAGLPAVGDFNFDGYADIAVTSSGVATGNLKVFLGDGSGGLLETKTLTTTKSFASQTVTGDFNGDGFPDLAVAHTGSGDAISVLYGDGTGNFDFAYLTSPSESDVYLAFDAIAVDDFNLDGTSDLLVSAYIPGAVYGLLSGLEPSTAELISVSGMSFDPQIRGLHAGQLVQGSGNAFDGLNRLRVGSTDFEPTGASVFADSGATVVTGSQMIDGLTVSREITVPTSGAESFARTIESFANSTGADITTTVTILGNLGSDSETTVFASSDGDTDVETTDQWFGTDDADGSGSPALVHFVHGKSGLTPTDVQVVGDNVVWTYDLTVPAGVILRLMTLTVAADTRADAVAAAGALLSETELTGQTAVHLSQAEIDSIANFRFNSAPVAVADSIITDEDNPVEFNVLADNGNGVDYDPDGTIVASLTTADSPLVGTLTDLGDGNFRYDPTGVFDHLPLGSLSPITISYQIVDNEGETATSYVTVNVFGVNDIAVVGGDVTGNTDEDAVVPVTGALTIVDLDSGQESFISQTDTAGTYGNFSVDSSGNWSYQVDTTKTQLLVPESLATDSFEVVSLDGVTSTLVEITIAGLDDPAEIVGDLRGEISEDATEAVAGQVNVNDPDLGDNLVVAQVDVAGSYGTFSIAATGNWTYTIDNASAQSLNEGDEFAEEFEIQSIDGTDTNTVTVTVLGLNDVAAITGDASGETDEDNAAPVTGTLVVTDADENESGLISQTSTAGLYGSFSVDESGNWTYTLDNASVQSLSAGSSVTDEFTVTSLDGGTTQAVEINIVGNNDDAAITGELSGNADEDATSAVTGTATVTDPDSGESGFQADGPVLGDYGSFSIDAGGNWTYTVDTTSTQAFNAGDEFSDTFQIVSADGGTTADVVITISGNNDIAEITGDVSGSTNEDATTDLTGTLLINDADEGESLAVAQTDTAGVYGTFSVTESGAWSYTMDPLAVYALNAGDIVTDSFDVSSLDGSGIVTVDIQITGVNDLATISGDTTGATDEDATDPVTGSLTVTDVDENEAALVPQLISGSYGSFSITANGDWSYTVDNGASQTLRSTDVVSDVFVVESLDASASLEVVIEIAGLNNIPDITGDFDATVIEDQVGIALGQLDIDDPDDSESQFIPQSDTAGDYGTFQLSASGAWQYTLDDSAVQSLGVGETLDEVFEVVSLDDSATVFVSILIEGTNDDPVIDTITASAGTAESTSSADPVVLSVDFTDLDLNDVHQVEVAWGESPGVYEPIVIDPYTRSIETSHLYAAPGEYTISVRIEDSATAFSVATADTIVSGTETFIVNTTADALDANIGDGIAADAQGRTTLRAVLQEVNASPDYVDHVILFDIPLSQLDAASSRFVITPVVQLPEITQKISILGGSQLGAGVTPAIEIRGTSIPGIYADGLRVRTDDVFVDSLLITSFPRDGIDVQGASGVEITNSEFAYNGQHGIYLTDTTDVVIRDNEAYGNASSGIRVSGPLSSNNSIINNRLGVKQPTGPGISQAIGNSSYGIYIASPENLIQNNTISGNSQSGIVIGGPTANDNQIFGNYIGVDSSGYAAVGNGGFGIYVGEASGTQIGGPEAGQGNVVSGNGNSGVFLNGSVDTTIQNNIIGLNAAGNAALPNAKHGVHLQNHASGNTISNNVITANTASQIFIFGALTSGNTITGNKVGFTADGSGVLQGGQRAIWLKASGNVVGGTTQSDANWITGATTGISLGTAEAMDNVVLGNYVGTSPDIDDPIFGLAVGVEIYGGASNNQVGPDNVIANNWRAAVRAYADSINNQITQNSMTGNVNGIDLGPVGLDPNDAGDVDDGPNHLQNSITPLSDATLTSTGATTAELHLDFTVDSAVENSAYPLTVEFFVADENGHGLQYLGSSTFVEVDLNAGTASVDLTIDVNELNYALDYLTATVTDNNGNTSEFAGRMDVVQTVNFSFTNAVNVAPLMASHPMDVNKDQVISALDALQVINGLAELRAEGETVVDTLRDPRDVNRDGRVSALDALLIVNQLREGRVQSPLSTFTETVDDFFTELDEEESLVIEELLENSLF
ncbi:VCBS domain-containing protein [Stieleria varia]|uniref:FG-GAP repeat protein n=1 Tax=Stieleria varia TaxID=2528005 RepID=A0A5C6AXT7_9BACT|nr:VCBS domain-containing protein [Stieleria varia]TWU04277.1 FG-GAP repeat protein [Stieleria varia]